MKLTLKHFIPAILWFIITVILLTLPASEFPDTGMFHIPQQDKIIHIILFFFIVFLFCQPFKKASVSSLNKKSWFISIAFYGLAYGIIIEFIQNYFVANRSYDVWDIVADGAGCALGYLYSSKYFLSRAKK